MRLMKWIMNYILEVMKVQISSDANRHFWLFLSHKKQVQDNNSEAFSDVYGWCESFIMLVIKY